MRRSVRLSTASGAAAVALSVVFAAAATGAAAAPARSTLPGSQPSWATSKALRSAAPATDVVHARVYLPWRNQAQLDALTRAVSTPGNAQYRRFLTPQQFLQQFAPAQQDVTAVRSWLTGAGFTLSLIHI